MSAKRDLLLIAAAAMVGGFVAGLLYAPHTGRELRRRIGRQAEASARWMEDSVHLLEERFHTLERRVEALAASWAARVQEATEETLDEYVPLHEDEATEWSLEKDEMTGELRRMPRS